MGSVNITPFQNTDTATADAFNERFAAITQTLNGNIDADNIAPGSITAELIASDMLNKTYPVGSLYFNGTVDTNPATLLGFGVWTQYGAGRVMVGYDGSQTEFNAVGKTGGDKNLASHSHTGTTSTIGDHVHGFSQDVAYTDNSPRRTSASGNLQAFGFSGITTAPAGGHNHSFTTSTAGTGTAGNLQPYITVYCWIRTS